MVDFIQKNRNNREVLNDWLKTIFYILNKFKNTFFLLLLEKNIQTKKNKFS